MVKERVNLEKQLMLDWMLFKLTLWNYYLHVTSIVSINLGCYHCKSLLWVCVCYCLIDWLGLAYACVHTQQLGFSTWSELPTSDGAMEWDMRMNQNGAIFEIFRSMRSYIKLVEIGVILSLFLTLKSDFRWGNCLRFPLNEYIHTYPTVRRKK